MTNLTNEQAADEIATLRQMRANKKELAWSDEALRMAEAALRAQGEPVAWSCVDMYTRRRLFDRRSEAEQHLRDIEKYGNSPAGSLVFSECCIPLYTHPQGEEHGG
jgi:hypothetical protein